MMLLLLHKLPVSLNSHFLLVNFANILFKCLGIIYVHFPQRFSNGKTEKSLFGIKNTKSISSGDVMNNQRA